MLSTLLEVFFYLIMASILGVLIGYVIGSIIYKSQIEDLEDGLDIHKTTIDKLKSDVNDLKSKNLKFESEYEELYQLKLASDKKLNVMKTELEECFSRTDDLSQQLSDKEYELIKAQRKLDEYELKSNLEAKKVVAAYVNDDMSTNFKNEVVEERSAIEAPKENKPLVKKDDLKLVKGIGPMIEEKLNNMGIYTFRQIAELTNQQIEMISDALEFFPGRIERDEWKSQATDLMA